MKATLASVSGGAEQLGEITAPGNPDGTAIEGVGSLKTFSHGGIKTSMSNDEKPKTAQAAQGPSGPRQKRPWKPPVIIHESLPSSTFSKAHATPPEFDSFKGPKS